MKQYTNYIFDFYGTLVDIETDEDKPSFWKKMAELYSVYGADYSWKELKNTYRALVVEEERLLRERIGCKEPEILLEKVFLRLYKEAKNRHECDFVPENEEEFLYHIANTFRVLSRKRLKAYKNTISTLKELKKNGCNTYLLSNAQGIFTRPEIEICGVAPYLDDIFISSDHERKKPDKAFLEELIQKYHLNRKETVMIGNDFISDMGIAHACNVDGIFLNSFLYDENELKKRNRYHHPVIDDISEILQPDTSEV